MSELSFEQMLEESLKTIRTGEIVTGKVIDVKDDEIVLNIGYKSDGIIPRSEYTNDSNGRFKKSGTGWRRDGSQGCKSKRRRGSGCSVL